MRIGTASRGWSSSRPRPAAEPRRASWIEPAGMKPGLWLKQHQVGGEKQELDADAAANLRKQAVDVLSLATNGKGK